jgi:hypothetical protein
MLSLLIDCIKLDATVVGVSTTPKPSVCIAQFKGLALLVVCAYMEMFLFFFIVTFISLFRVFNILHFPKWS